MKKALQMVPLRARGILPERAAVRRARETKGDGFCNDFPQALVANVSRERCGLRTVLLGRLLRRVRRAPRTVPCGAAGRTRGEREARRRARPEARADLLGPARQLERPDRIR